MTEKKPKPQYVDPDLFFKAMKDRVEQVKIAKENDQPLPRVSEYIGECIVKIATNFSNLNSYRNYPFKEDMILDAVENCIKVVDNFNPTISENPFSYFTQITYFAFLRRIAKEKKQIYVKSKLLSSNALDLHQLQEHDEDGEFTNHYVEYMKAFNNFDGSSFEKKLKDKPEKKEQSVLEEFYE